MKKPIARAVRNAFQKAARPAAIGVLSAMMPQALLAQTDEQAENTTLEEVIVVGSQIRGASITEALAVTVVSAEDIEVMGVDSGDELLALIPENGQNFFNEAENISGGVNSARGDIGAFNLRNLGTGNTLVLLNGRRLVNAASYQTEEVGGSFIPVNSVNSQTLPVWGIERVEVLRDGASAIYGADAVAGVVNTVLKNDFEGFNIRFKHTEFDHLPGDRQGVTAEWGQSFNQGRTNVGVFFNYYSRDRVSSLDDPRWSDSDFRYRIPEGSLWSGDTAFRNNSANSLYGQFDIVPRVSSGNSLRQNDVVDNAGEFEVYPLGDSRCSYAINDVVCGAEDGQGTVRHNFNSANGVGRDIASELDRLSLFVNINHELSNGMESFTELLAYQSESNLIRHASYSFSTSELVLSKNSYYNPLGAVGSPNRLPDSIVGDGLPAEGLDIVLDNYRFAEVPRIIDNDGETYRFLQGFRGTVGAWDWESAVSWSRATKDDITRNRVSNTLMQEALNDPTEAGYNPFTGGLKDSNIERALVDVYRKSETELTTFDVKFSNPEIMALPAGPMGMVVGVEWRDESFKDDRDPRLDGTIVFTDKEGDTYPFVSDVVNSSPTPDNSGSRSVTSVFAELQVPVLDNLDVQLALRHEDLSDIPETATVGKFAFGYRPFEPVLIRGSWSEAFRAPNLVTVNESVVARNNTRTDWACEYANAAYVAANGLSDDFLSCRASTQRVALGSDQLVPEESENMSLGLVLTPTDNLTITVDYWEIEKEGTIGLFGEENHTLLDLVYRIEAGASNCSSTGNTAVERIAPDDDQVAAYAAAGICAGGDISRIVDQYKNLDTRTMKGHDIGVYYDIDTDLGAFRFSYNGAFLDEFEQTAGGNAATLVAAQNAGILPMNYPIDGFADLVGRDGNQDEKHTARLTWRKSAFGASLAAYKIGEFYQSSLTLADGTRYVIPSMTTYDATFDYRTELMGTKARFRLGVKNFTDERAPLADRYFGYFSDAHTDYGRYMYLDVRASF